MAKPRSMKHPWVMLGFVVAGTLLILMGTDLVLPAVPSLPESLGGDAAQAQLVLAAYVGGTCAGLLAYGALGDRLSTRALFIGSLVGTAAVSLACAAAGRIEVLIALRALQGAVAAGPAVFAPGIVRALFDEVRAVRAIGLLGSIEALAPAIAPLVGAWLLGLGGWRLSFEVIGILALLVACSTWLFGDLPQTERRARGSYARLLVDPVFVRYALSHALSLGGMLVFVFGMPTVFVLALGGSITDFVVMQVCGVGTFVLTANASGRLVSRLGAERLISFGTGLATVAAGTMLVYALSGGSEPLAIAALWIPVNGGFGLRGPTGFFRAVVAARGDDARGSALVILALFGAASCGTAIAAPCVEDGLAPLAGIALGFHALSVLLLALLPRWMEPVEPSGVQAKAEPHRR